MPSPYQIQGQLPWQGGGGGMMLAAAGSDPVARQIGQSYQNAYQDALGFNQQNYANILAGYQQAGQNLGADTAGVAAGYGRLSSDVLGGLQGSEASRRQDIAAAFAGQRGQMAQNLIGRGLGNTTIRSSAERGLNFDEQRAYTDLANQMAQTRAGYQSQLGLAGLGYEASAAAQRNAQANQQLGWMNTVEAGYPDAGAYGGLLQQRGAALQSEANRAQAAQQFQQIMDAARQNRDMADRQFQQLYGNRPQAAPQPGQAPPPPAAPQQALPPPGPGRGPALPPRPPGGIGAPMPSIRGVMTPPFPAARGPQFGPQFGPRPMLPPPRGLNVQGGAQQQAPAAPQNAGYPGSVTLYSPQTVTPWNWSGGGGGAGDVTPWNWGGPAAPPNVPQDVQDQQLDVWRQMETNRGRLGAAEASLARARAMALPGQPAGGVDYYQSQQAMMAEAQRQLAERLQALGG